MKIDEVIQKWNAAKEIDDFTKIQLAEMLDSAVQYIEQQNAAQQSVHPTLLQCDFTDCQEPVHSMLCKKHYYESQSG